MGAAGAGLASTLATASCGVIISAYYFHKHEKYVSFHREQMQAATREVWKRLIFIGLPVGLEFFLMSLVMAVIYWVIREFGAAAQAGFGVKGRASMRIIMLPAMAVAFAAAPIAGQNFGARKPERVRETFNWTVVFSVVIMLLLTVLCQFESQTVHAHLHERRGGGRGRRADADDHARGISPRTASSSAARRCSRHSATPGRPSCSSAIRLFVFIVPAIWLSTRPDFELVHVWYVSVASMFIQAVIALLAAAREFRASSDRRCSAARAPRQARVR